MTDRNDHIWKCAGSAVAVNYNKRYVALQTDQELLSDVFFELLCVLELLDATELLHHISFMSFFI